MIIRATLAGIVLWFAMLAALHFAGPMFFYPDEQLLFAMFVAAPFAMIALTWALLKLLRVAPGDQAEAAVAIALPGMLFSAYSAANFSTLFPPLDPVLDATFAGLMLEGYAFVLFTGIFLTRLAPQDERV